MYPVFVVPGMGALSLKAITPRDYVLVMGDVLVFALAVLIVNLAVDVIYAWLDPRIRFG